MAYDGTPLRGTASYPAGKFGNALAGAAFTLGTVFQALLTGGAKGGSMVQAFTMELWVKTTATSVRVPLGEAGTFWFGITNTGQSKIAIGGGTSGEKTFNGPVINDGNWHHLAFVNDQGGLTQRFYVDGVQAQSATWGSALTTNPLAGDLALGAYGGNSSVYDWYGAGGGLIDEVRISNVARYTGSSFTPATAAFEPDNNTMALYHLDANVANSDGRPTVGTITASSSAGTDTITYPAPVAGASPVSSVALFERTAGGSYGAAVATNNSAAAGTFTRPSPTSADKFYVVRATDSRGRVSDASNEVSTTSDTRVEFGPTNPALLYSPYNWDVTADRALCNTGGYIRTVVIRGSNVRAMFDVSAQPANVTQLNFRWDEGAWQTAPIAAEVSLPLPAGEPAGVWTQHILEIGVKSTTEGANRWASPYATAAKFLGLRVGYTAGQTVPTLDLPVRRELHILVLGDSITEGINTYASSGDTTVRSDSRMSYAHELGDALGAETGIVGFGYQGLLYGGNGSVPTLPLSWDLVAAGLPRSFTPAPDAVFINIGTNDKNRGGTAAAFTAAYTSLLNDMLAKLPPKTRIFVVFPFGGHFGITPYRDAIAACINPDRVTFIDTTGWWSTSEAPDGVHPYGWVNIKKLGPRLAAAARPWLGPHNGRTYINVGGNWVPA